MFQQDYSEFAFSSSTNGLARSAVRVPLWLQAWRLLRLVGGGFGARTGRLAEALDRLHSEAVTVRELSALSNRDLYDIGIDRSEIRSIAREMAQGKGQTRQRAQARQAVEPTEASLLTLVPRQKPTQPCCP